MKSVVQPPIKKNGTAIDGSWAKAIDLKMPVNSTITGITVNGFGSGSYPPIPIQVEIILDGVAFTVIDNEKIVSRGGGKTFHPFWIGRLQLSPFSRVTIQAFAGNFTGTDEKIELAVFNERWQ